MQTKLSTRDKMMSHLQQTTAEQLQQLQAQLEGKETELASLNSHLTELKDAADVSLLLASTHHGISDQETHKAVHDFNHLLLHVHL